MSAKKIITAVLLTFVLVSVVYLLTNEIFIKQSAAQKARNDSASTISNVQSGTSKVIAYYFHRTRRCVTCTKLEQYSDEAIRKGFGDALKTGRLEWKSLNIEEPANQHFEVDYKLHTQSLVLVRMAEGRQKSWKNLEKIWELVGAKEIFISYVQEELTAYLAENS